MARRKNVKRIDPRYFLNETVNRGEELQEGPSIPAAEYAGESGIPPRRAHRAKTWVELRLKELGDLDAVLAMAEEDPSIGEHMMFAIQTEVEKLAGPAGGVSQQE